MSDDARKRIRSIAAIGGVGLASYGLWLFSPAAALVALGLTFCGGAFMSHVHDVRRKLKDGETNGV